MQTQWEQAARAQGWSEGGGYIYDSRVFGSWKEAVSWSGDDGRTEEEESESAIYGSWEDCCKNEGINPIGTEVVVTDARPLVDDDALPSTTFDFLWGIKTKSQLRHRLQHLVTELVEIQDAIRQHEIKLEWDTSFEVTPQQMERIAIVSRFVKDPTDDNWQTLLQEIKGPERAGQEKDSPAGDGVVD